MKYKAILLPVILFAGLISINGNLNGQPINGDFNVTSDWGSGYCADITLTNNGSTTINDWVFVFDLSADITTLWNAGTWSGNQAQGYTATNAGWNGTINPGGSVTIGYCANYSGSITPPDNAFLNGIPVSFGGGGGGPSPPTISIISPVNGAYYVMGNTIALEADANDSDGTIAGVDFNINGQIIPASNSSGSTWQASWVSGTIGAITISAIATDNDNLTATDDVQISIQNNNSSVISGVFNVSSDWGSGYTADITLSNNGTVPVNGWDFDFDLMADITSVWNVSSWSGSQSQGYTTTNASWNGTINPGASVSFGFNANYSGSIFPPTNAYLNGLPVSFGGGGNPVPPTISITSPASGTSFQVNTLITLIANATDTDGNITGVEYNIDGLIIPATNNSGSTWQAEWTPVTSGTFTIIATATDNDNLTATDNTQIIIEEGGGGGSNYLTLSGLPLQINIDQGDTQTYIFNQNISGVLSRNLNVVSISVNGNEVSFSGLNPGRTGLKITSGGQDYYMGLRINHTDGSIPGLPDYLSVGSVSEDIAGDLAFWKDVNAGQMNKSMDIRYIYINGGPFTGWQSWGPNRPETFATESLRHGLIPFFVYYNIPDGGESFYVDSIHVNDPTYMTAYFDDLNLFLNKVKTVMQDELYGIILEPDFLGYIQQNANPSDPELFPTCVSENSIAQGAGNLRSLVERINNTIDGKRSDGHNIFYGWQMNLWAYPVANAPQGVIRITDQLGYEAGRATIHNASEQTTLYAIQSGVLTNNANFLSIDKYGLDAMGHQNTPDPANSTWFFNNDHWMNYLYFAETIYQTSGFPVILWQLPVGHINNSQFISAYTGNPFNPLPNTNTKYEDSSTDFFFGDTYTAFNNDRLTYFSENLYNDPILLVSGDNITWGSHMQGVKDAGIITVLFGAGVGISTDGIGDPPTDDYFWIQKVQDYYLNGTIPLNWSMFNDCSGGCPPNVSITSPHDGEEMVVSQLNPIGINVTAWDFDGQLSSLSIEIDGQIIAMNTSGYVHSINWTPPDFGTYNLIASATDDSLLTSTDSISFSIVEFDPDSCGVPLWDVNTVYSSPGNQVSWDGNIYENKWWTQGDEPGTGGWSDPWEFISSCSSKSIAEFPSDKNSNLELNFSVFPNPADNIAYINIDLPGTSNIRVGVLDQSGRMITNTPVQTYYKGNQTIKLNTNDIVPGLYIIQLKINDLVISNKLMIR